MAANKLLIMNGFKEDCEQLIARFERADNIRFDTFCEIWKTMKFSLVFAGRPNLLELLEFCEEALHICKQFVLLPPRFKERIGGLYLLYGIYFKMPVDQFKIRLKLDDWKNILELHTEIKEGEHLDANYILCKLIASNAFHFCIFDSEYGMEKPYTVKNTQYFNSYSILPTLRNLSEKNQLLSKIDELSKAYEQKKEESKLINPLDTSLKLFNSNIAQEIINDIQEFEEQRRNKQKSITDFEKPCCSTSKEQSLKEHKKFHLKETLKRKIRALVDDIEDQNESKEKDEILESD
ncbi:snRNA-activating protein complex subunit 1 [Melipona quadrifasciata]|uniref:snRNA-activating protein complex subunit 1 n=1 Tax=Melipona quadrifasciata TaxID=166423 RepID=A0A0N0U7E6_9HYME|nr:snRNA-activating protein complex subunit 1 [Melipona quadrifasciata]